LTINCRRERSERVIVPDPRFAQENLGTSTGLPTASAREETTSLALLLAEVNALAIRVRQRGRPMGGSQAELPGAEHAVLEIIDRFGQLTVPQIARERSTSRQNIQILVDRLASQGRIQLSPNPAHKRSALVQLTHEGKVSLHTGDRDQKQLLAEIGVSLSQPEINATVAVLRRIHGLLSGEKDNGKQRASLAHSNRERTPKIPERAVDNLAAAEEFPVNLL
jgi:DNA-binding MarR family transcriptional regulator